MAQNIVALGFKGGVLEIRLSSAYVFHFLGSHRRRSALDICYVQNVANTFWFLFGQLRRYLWESTVTQLLLKPPIMLPSDTPKYVVISFPRKREPLWIRVWTAETSLREIYFLRSGIFCRERVPSLIIALLFIKGRVILMVYNRQADNGCNSRAAKLQTDWNWQGATRLLAFQASLVLFQLQVYKWGLYYHFALVYSYIWPQ